MNHLKKFIIPIVIICIFTTTMLSQNIVLSEPSVSNLILEYIHEWSDDESFDRYRVNDICAADVDGDGVIEILTVGSRTNSLTQGQLRIFTWDGLTFIVEKNELFMVGENETVIECIDVGDLNGDESLEIVITGISWRLYGAHECDSYSWIRVYAWNGVVLTLLDTKIESDGSVKIKDLNNDGNDEVITGDTIYPKKETRSQLRVWRWNSELQLEDNKEWVYGINRLLDESSGASRLNSVTIGKLNGEIMIAVGGCFWGNHSKYWGELTVWSYASNLTLEARVEWESEGDPVEWAQFWTWVEDVFIEDNKIYTVGWMNNGTFNKGQLRIWNWEPLSIETSKEWLTVDNTFVFSVFVVDVDSDHIKDIITGGYHIVHEEERANRNAQLRIWNYTSIITLKDTKEWYTNDHTEINAVYVKDVDEDGVKEIITAGNANDSKLGQVTIWSYSSIELPSPPAIPGFPLEAMLVGIIIVAITIYVLKKKLSPLIFSIK